MTMPSLSSIEIPIVRAFDVPADIVRRRHCKQLKDKWIVPCCYCGHIHNHDPIEGLLIAPCPPLNAFSSPSARERDASERPRLYFLEHHGEAPAHLAEKLLLPQRYRRWDWEAFPSVAARECYYFAKGDREAFLKSKSLSIPQGARKKRY